MEIFFILILVASFFISCSREKSVAGDKLFAVGTESLTFVKSALTDTVVQWSPDDELGVWDGVSENLFKTSSRGSVCQFGGKACSSNEYYFIYPFDSSAVFSGGVIDLSLPSSQKASAGTFDPYANISVGKTSGTAVFMKNIAGYVKIRIVRDNIKEIRLRANSSADLAGKIEVSFQQDGKLSYSVLAGEKEISLAGSPSGTNVLAAGTYYLAVLPQTLAGGYEMTFTDSEGNETSVSSNDDIAIDRSMVADLGNDEKFIAYIHASCDDNVVSSKGDRVEIKVDAAENGWNYSMANCDWLKEVSRDDGHLVLEVTKDDLEAVDDTASVAFVNGINPDVKDGVKIILSSRLLFDARFQPDGSAVDGSKNHYPIDKVAGEYFFTYYNKTAGKYVARFTPPKPGGARATSYFKFDYSSLDGFLDKLASGHTIECTFMLDHSLNGSYNKEMKPFSSMQSGGTGFVIGETVYGNHMFFLPNTGSWIFADSKIVPALGAYYHMVGTYDKVNRKARIYVNGNLAGEYSAGSAFKAPSTGSHWFCIGGDSQSSGCGESWRGDVVTARIYEGVLDDSDVETLWSEENKGYPGSSVTYEAAFFGDSITERWIGSGRGDPAFFMDNNWLNRGISGETTSDMSARFSYDLLQVAPKIMVFCGGTNDIAQNDGVYVSNKSILANIEYMAEQADAGGIKVVLCSLLPANAYYWNTSVGNPSERIKSVNALIKSYAEKMNFTYVDYWTPLHDDSDGMPAKYSDDGVHPNKACYTVMEGIIKPVIKQLSGN
ncbi:MAG: GDSL-type esterase/lipase family protein [Bacteroidales bacterium]|jgi:lysophospholipase L1-like esterase|nr:GDSL-type esterase/lipase family protein [Bacteroidales bacterium]